MSRCKERLVSMPSPTADMLISLLWTTTFWVKLYIEKNYHSLWWLFCNHWITFSNKKYIIKTEDQVYKQKYFIWDKKINTEHWLEAPSTDNFYSCGESGTSDYISSKTWSHTSYRWGREPLLWVATCPAYENSRSQLVEVEGGVRSLRRQKGERDLNRGSEREW